MSTDIEHLDYGRVGWLERPGVDFPYYNGRPVSLTGIHWILVVLAVEAGFLALVYGVGNIGAAFGSFVPVVLYVAIPLGILAIVSQGHWRALFRKVGWRDVLLMIGFALVSIAVSLVVGFLLVNLTDTISNAAVAGLAEQGTADIVLFNLRTLIQLLGEEVMTNLPFLALP